MALYTNGDWNGIHLEPFQVWVGSAAGDVDPSGGAIKCDLMDGADAERGHEHGPAATLACGGAVGSFLTLQQMGEARFLYVSEMFIYEPLAHPPPSPPPERWGKHSGAYHAPAPPALGSLADEINSRFLNGRPSVSLAEAGVVIHTFDDFEDWDSQRPWMVCSSLRCQGEVDHLSASLINARVPVLFSGGGAGLVLSPTAELLCSYAYDT